MASNQNNLNIVLDKRRETLNRDVSVEESKQLRSSLLSQYSWPELLQSAPTVINSVGACYIASASKTATVDLKQPENGFKYLR